MDIKDCVKKPLVVLTGPTAVGKTDISIKVAKNINKPNGAEIISADSIQVYKYMDIGSGKVTNEEMQGVKHHLISTLDPSVEFNIYTFKNMAKKATEDIYSLNKVPIIAGGTGFYIQSLLYDVEFSEEENDHAYRKELEELAKDKGCDYLYEMLLKVDPDAAAIVHKNNVKRVIRALEFYKETGNKISVHNEEQKMKESPYEFKYYVINMEREKLYKRIELRVDKMIEAGLVNEVKGLLDKGYSKELVSMQGLGYKEIVSYLLGEISLDEAVYIIKRDTRHFAKRQLTWFKREKDVTMINYEDFSFSQDEIANYLINDIDKMIDKCKGNDGGNL